MGLRAKFNLMLLAVALAGVLLFGLASTPALNALAQNEVEQNSRIMMEAALGARQYTSQEIAPLLKDSLATALHPQSVSAYAAKKDFAVLKSANPDSTARRPLTRPIRKIRRRIGRPISFMTSRRIRSEAQDRKAFLAEVSG